MPVTFVPISTPAEFGKMVTQIPQHQAGNLTLDAWLRGLGFTYDDELKRVRNPFDFFCAENDPALNKSHVPLLESSWFLTPAHLVVFGLSGSGKTALRVFCEQKIQSTQQPDDAADQSATEDGLWTRHVQLCDLLLKHFSLNELNKLCFDLGIDPEDIPGAELTTKAFQLILHCKRHGLLRRLIAICRQSRPTTDLELKQIEIEAVLSSSVCRPIHVFTTLHDVCSTLFLDQPQLQRSIYSQESAYIFVDIADNDERVFRNLDAPDAERLFNQTTLQRLADNGIYLRAFLPLWFEPFTKGRQSLQSWKIEWSVPALRELIRNRLTWAKGGRTLQLAQICDISWQIREDPDEAIALAGVTPRRVLAVGYTLFLCHVSRWGNGEPRVLTFQDRTAALRTINQEVLL